MIHDDLFGCSWMWWDYEHEVEKDFSLSVHVWLVVVLFDWCDWWLKVLLQGSFQSPV